MLGATLVVAILIAAQIGLVWLSPGLTGRRTTTFEEVIPLIAVLAGSAAIGLAAALVAWRRRPQTTRAALLLIIAGGLAMRLVWFGATPPMEDDYYRYLWDGAVTASGGDPYAVAPKDVAAAGLSDRRLQSLADASGTILSNVNFPDLRTIYPGTAQVVFAAAYLIAPFQIDGLRAVFLVADGAAVLALAVLLSRLGHPPWLIALYWLNPMVVYTGIGLVHADVVMVPALLFALVLSIAARPVAAGAVLGLAAGVKLWPILLAPLLVRQTFAHSPAHALAALAVCALTTAVLTAPLALSVFAPQSGLTSYAASWHINNAPYAWVSYGLAQVFGESDVANRALRIAVAGAAAIIAIAVAIPKIASPRDLVIRATIVAASVFYLSPAQFPWYALWFFGLAAAVPSFPLLAASATLAAYYSFGPAFQYGTAFLHCLPVWLWLLADLRRGAMARQAKAEGHPI